MPSSPADIALLCAGYLPSSLCLLTAVLFSPNRRPRPTSHHAIQTAEICPDPTGKPEPNAARKQQFVLGADIPRRLAEKEARRSPSCLRHVPIKENTRYSPTAPAPSVGDADLASVMDAAQPVATAASATSVTAHTVTNVGHKPMTPTL